MQDDIQLFVHVRILKQTVVAQSYIFLLSFTTPFTIYEYFQLFADKTVFQYFSLETNVHV